MKLNKACEVIAKYMGWSEMLFKDFPTHFVSLDNLIPVWEKLSDRGIWININRHGIDDYTIAICGQSEQWNTDMQDCPYGTPKEAATVVTAMAILEKLNSRKHTEKGQDNENI